MKKNLLLLALFSILASGFLLGSPSKAEAAIAFRSATTTNNASGCGTQSVTVNVPAGTVNGDVMVVGVQYGGSTQMSTPAGWTLINHVSNSFSTTQKLTTFYRVASSEPASYTWAMPALVCWITSAASYSGVSNSSPIDAQTTVGVTTGTSIVGNAVTTTSANDMIVTIFSGYNGSSTTWTPPAGQTERVDSNNASVRSIELNDSTQAGVGSSGTFTATASVSNYGAIATIALKMAGCGGTYSVNGSGVSGSVQSCTVGTTGKYTVSAYGASGGINGSFGVTGGNGAVAVGDVYLTSGEVINIMVGQIGGNGTGGGGGGGSFVVKSTGNVPLVIAGGGGGAHQNNGGNASTTNNGTPNGGTGVSYGTGGAGFQTNGGLGGSAGGTGITASLSFINGGTGGATNTGGTATGGYGGGGGAHSGCGGGCGAGGGGGYNGGNAQAFYGDGGGSFNAGVNQGTGATSGNGSVVITYVGGTAGPLVISPTSASVSYTTATLGGNVTSDGGSAVSGRGACVSTSPNPALGGTCFSTTGTTGIFTIGASSLSASTTYYYRAYATNANGTTYSENGTFTTLAQSAPTIATPTKSVTSNVAATLGGNITSGGTAAIDARGICYSITATNASPQHGGTGVTCLNEGGTATGVFTMSVSALTQSTGYSYKAFAHNSVGYAYTSADTFTTFGPPSVTTSAAGSVSNASAILNATVNPNGASTNASYLWGTSNVACSLLPNTLTGPANLTGIANVSPNATTLNTGLSPNTTYYFCVMATNSYGTTYDTGTLNFTTTPTPGAYGYLGAGSVLGGGATDCDDTTAAPCPPVISSVDTPTQTSLTVNWSAGTGPTQTSYDVFWCDRTANGACSPSTQITNATSPYVHSSGPTCGRTYAYLVRANNASGTSADSNVVAALTSNCVSSPSITAQGTSGTPGTTTTFTSSVNGNAAATNITYRYSTSNLACNSLGSTFAGTQTNFTGAVSDSTAKSGLTGNTTYYYCATATNSQGTTNGVSNGNANSIILTAPGAATGGTATGATTTQINVSWTAPSGGAASYNLKWCYGASCTPGGSGTNFGTINGATSTYAHTGLAGGCGTTYRYIVTAVNATGSTDSALFSGSTSACYSYSQSSYYGQAAYYNYTYSQSSYYAYSQNFYTGYYQTFYTVYYQVSYGYSEGFYGYSEGWYNPGYSEGFYGYSEGWY